MKVTAAHAVVTLTVLMTYFSFDYEAWQSITPTVKTTTTEEESSSSSSAPAPPTIPQYVIDQAKQRARQLKNATQAIEEVRVLAADHPAFRTMSKKFLPPPEWQKWRFPDVSIAGLQKAGSSQLYNVLRTHEEMTNFHKNKEFPFGIAHLSMNIQDLIKMDDSNSASQDKLLSLQKTFFTRSNRDVYKNSDVNNSTTAASQSTNSKPKLTVNACLDTSAVTMTRQYLNRTRDSKLILLVRDPADWLWSAYNFWHLPGHHDAKRAAFADWAGAKNQYRSPELFHEMLLAGSDRFGPTVQLIGKYRDRIANLATRVIAAAAAADGKGDKSRTVMVVKTEDMTPDRIHSSGFLENMADFLGVSIDGFNKTIIDSFSNCGNNRGIHSKCAKATTAYAIAGNRPMLEESRDLVYLYFAEECRMWAEQFGVIYERCLEVSDHYNLTVT